jgi:hypothetical protein
MAVAVVMVVSILGGLVLAVVSERVVEVVRFCSAL